MNDVITLIQTSAEQNENGYIQPVITSQQDVFAEKRSVSRNEFYSALSVGISASAVFLIHTEDYNGENIVIYNDKRFRVERTYQKIESDYIELTCSDMKE